MDWLSKYWWILVLVFLVGVLLNVIKDLKRVDHKKFLANKPDLPPHRDFNDKWDDEDDWPKKDQKKYCTHPSPPAPLPRGTRGVLFPLPLGRGLG